MTNATGRLKTQGPKAISKRSPIKGPRREGRRVINHGELVGMGRRKPKGVTGGYFPIRGKPAKPIVESVSLRSFSGNV